MSNKKQSKKEEIKVVKNGWVNFGRIVDKKLKDGQTKPDKALVLDRNVTIEITEKKVGKDKQEYLLKRTIKGGTYFNITPAEQHVERLYANNAKQLEQQLEFLDKNPYIKHIVSLAPEREEVEYDIKGTPGEDDDSDDIPL